MKLQPLHANRHSAQRGATMVELLVALLIFSFGMLGVAGLQTKTIAFSQSSLFRSQASSLTDDILDRMRADRIGAMGGRWNTSIDDLAAEVSVSGTGIVTTDLAAWKQEVERLLPEGRASVAVAVGGAGAGEVRIIIRWADSRDTNADPVEFITITRL
jgi:type IV pilus assembly protein PilV